MKAGLRVQNCPTLKLGYKFEHENILVVGEEAAHRCSVACSCHLASVASDRQQLMLQTRRGAAAQGITAREWQSAHAAALSARGGAEMFDLMSRVTCCLVMDWVPATSLLKAEGPFQAHTALQTASDLGRRAGHAPRSTVLEVQD